ncbi:MAG: alpha/beta fold hydrolase, partial [Planctomycetota bacterium]
MATPAATTAATAPPRWRSLYPFASNWLETSAGRLHYVDVGPDGRADELGDEQADPSDRGGDQGCVLFVHGNPTWSFHWRDAISRLRADHRCVAVDHLGCGLSDKPPRRFRLADRIEHVVRLIDELDLRAITLVAQDWGGAIGLGATLQRPDRLRRIVLLNTGAFTPHFVPRRIAVCRTPVVGRVALQGAGLFSRAALRMTMSRRPLPADVAGGYLAPYDSWANRRAVYEFVADIPTSPRHPTWQTLA